MIRFQRFYQNCNATEVHRVLRMRILSLSSGRTHLNPRTQFTNLTAETPHVAVLRSSFNDRFGHCEKEEEAAFLLELDSNYGISPDTLSDTQRKCGLFGHVCADCHGATVYQRTNWERKRGQNNEQQTSEGQGTNLTQTSQG